MRKERFLILLSVLLVLFVLRPLLTELGSSVVILDLLSIVLFLSCINAVSYKRRHIYISSILLCFGLGARILAETRGDESLKTVYLTIYDAFSVLFLIYTSILILNYVLRGKEVTRDRIAAAICVYLLLGVLWGAAYRLMYTLDPNSLSLGDVATVSLADTRHSRDFTYFSYVTLTTLGYGDITPKSPTFKYLASLEAIVGQLYLAILIARLVGIHIAQARRKEE